MHSNQASSQSATLRPVLPKVKLASHPSSQRPVNYQTTYQAHQIKVASQMGTASFLSPWHSLFWPSKGWKENKNISRKIQEKPVLAKSATSMNHSINVPAELPPSSS
eukprot:scaffold170156_cov19-Tisochrysis_lutea.AAC.1